jgi:hypothetical protein
MKTNCFIQENCHANEKTEAIAPRKEVPASLVTKVVDKETIIGNKGAEEVERRKGSLTPKKE